jgi:hypothetical protein
MKMHRDVPEVVAEASLGRLGCVGDDDAGGWGVPFRRGRWGTTGAP